MKVIVSFFFCLSSLILISAPVAKGQVTGSNPSQPILISLPKAVYPKSARDAGLSGTITVILQVDANGKVASIQEVVGPGWICPQIQKPEVFALRDSARATATKAKFRPGQFNGKPVPSTAQVEFTFRGRSSGVAGEDVFYKGAVGEKADKNLVASDKGTEAMEQAQAGRPRTLSGGVLNGKANSLSIPDYPAAARAVRAAGTVHVQVLIDTDGAVFSAEAKDGHPLLQPAARNAACQSKFMPTLLSGQPVRVSGIITYNFLP